MAAVPEVRSAMSGDLQIAYQVLGEGPCSSQCPPSRGSGFHGWKRARRRHPAEPALAGSTPAANSRMPPSSGLGLISLRMSERSSVA